MSLGPIIPIVGVSNGNYQENCTSNAKSSKQAQGDGLKSNFLFTFLAVDTALDRVITTSASNVCAIPAPSTANLMGAGLAVGHLWAIIVGARN